MVLKISRMFVVFRNGSRYNFWVLLFNNWMVLLKV